MAVKQLIVAVEGTSAMGPYWKTTLTDYLEKIIRNFCGSDLSGQEPASHTVEMSLVIFTSLGNFTACLVQRSGWTRDVEVFLSWLFALGFSGGGFNDVAVTEGLAEALMMFPPDSENQNQQNGKRQKHCILIAASNPNPIPTQMCRLQLQSLDQGSETDNQAESRLVDAATLSKLFAQRSVSLSVISPRMNPKYREIYNAGKRNPRAADPPIYSAKNPHFLVLISENFIEACSALSQPGVAGLPSSQNPVKMDVDSVVSVSMPPPTSTASGVSKNGPMMRRQPISTASIHPVTVKLESKTVPMVSGPSLPHIPNLKTSPISSPQEMHSITENIQESKPIVSGISQPSRPVQPAVVNANILTNLSQARKIENTALSRGTSVGLQSMGGTPMAMHMSNMISNGISSSVPAAQSMLPSALSSMTGIVSGTLPGTSQVAPNPNPTFPSSTSNISGNAKTGMSGMNQNMMNNNTLDPVNMSSGTGTMIPTPGMTQQAQLGGKSIGASNSSSPGMPSSQQNSGSQQGTQTKYVRVWEGNLSGHRQGQRVFITRLEGYRSSNSPETIAENWPQTMQIIRLISQDHMNNKHYAGKTDYLVFRAMNQHGFLGQLQDKKLCAVIQLPSQTLLMSVSDKACRLIGMLFPGDMVVIKPQIPSQPRQQEQHQQQQEQHQQQQMQQQQPALSQMQPQQMVGTGMGQTYVQSGSTRSGHIPQGQSSSSGSPTLPRQ